MSGPEARDAAEVLRATDVHIRYRLDGIHRRDREGRATPQEVHALRGVSFTLRAGESLAVVGENGAGKSSLLAALAGLLPLASGTVRATTRPRLLSVGAVLQPLWTGRESIRVGLAALQAPTVDRGALEEDIERFVELGDALDLPVRTYSRGMAGRLLFAINTAVPAGILIVDEALGGADGRFRQRAQARLDALLAASGALIVASHNRPTLERLCTRAILLRSGRVAAAGGVREILDLHEGKG